MKGAGGTSGGIAEFVVGIIMFVVGMYLFLSNVTVYNHFGFGSTIFTVGGSGGAGGFRFVTGMVLIPFIFGIGLIFYNRKNIIGWILAGGSIALLVIGLIASMQFVWRSMSVFELIIILVLLFGGIGLFLKSLRESKR